MSRHKFTENFLMLKVKLTVVTMCSDEIPQKAHFQHGI